MSNEWFDIAWVNFTKAILHGQFVDDAGREQQIELVLSDAQRDMVYDLNEAHENKMKALLRSFVQEQLS